MKLGTHRAETDTTTDLLKAHSEEHELKRRTQKETN